MARDSADRLDPLDVLNAYSLGYFPMARSRTSSSVVWVLPDERGVLPLEAARAPRRLLRTLRKEPFEIRCNTAFQRVINACAQAQSPDRDDTWINDQIEETYCELHFMGHAHSIEAYSDGNLVGGLYGVALGGIFCGESMFSTQTDASKIAMLHLITRLKMGGFKLLDTQFHTEHLAQFGVETWPDSLYQQHLQVALKQPGDFLKAPHILSSAIVAQSITQTS